MKGISNAPGKVGSDLESVKTQVTQLTKTATDAKTAADAAKKAADEALQSAQAALQSLTTQYNTIYTVPSQSNTLTYNGSPQSPTWSNYDTNRLTISGSTSQTNAGTYQVTFTPKGDCTWSDKSKTAKTVNWTIGRLAIPVPTQKTALTYTGSPQTVSWNNYDAAKMTLGGTTSGTEAKSYTATFAIGSNWKWQGDNSTGTKSVNWTIGRKKLTAIPSQNGTLTYSGSQQTPKWNNCNSSELTLAGVTNGTNAGTYTAKFTPTTNYCWSDGGTATKDVTWTINKATGSLNLSVSTLEITGKGKTGTITVTRPGDGAITVKSSADTIATAKVSGTTVTVTAVAKGQATITVSVAAGTNHTKPADKTCTVTVKTISTNLGDNGWPDIHDSAGDGDNLWHVGDTKPVTLNGSVPGLTLSSFKVDAFIIGFDHNSTVEGANRVHFQIGKSGGKQVAFVDSGYGNYYSTGHFVMNTTDTNSGGWENSYMRKTLLGNSGTPTSPPANSFLNLLPADLRSALQPTKKWTNNTGNTSSQSAVTETTDYLFLLSEVEVFGSTSYSLSYEKNKQQQYKYYSSGNSAKFYKHSDASTACYWWLRSPIYYYSNHFCLVYTSGSATTTLADCSAGVSPGFSV